VNFKLTYYGNPVLRKKARRVTLFDESLACLAAGMLEVMRDKEGLGLAAQQIGETVSLCVLDIPERMDHDDLGARLNPDVAMPMILANPRIERVSRETESYEEGCLSFPEITAPVIRPVEIDLTYEDLAGKTRAVRLRGLVARAAQHEMDHLAGVLIIDRMTPVKKLVLAGRLKRLRRETREALASISF